MRYLTVHDITIIAILLVLVGAIITPFVVPSTPNRGVDPPRITGTNMWQ